MKIDKLEQENRLHKAPMPIIALTGGVATGKSTVSDYLKNRGENIICADKLVHQIYEKKEAYEFISNLAPETVINNKIIFPKLREVFFSNKDLQTKIENFIYSHLPHQFTESYKKFHNPQYIFYDVPLLFEKKLDQLVDYIVVVYSTPEKQVQRLIIRDSISEDLAKNMLAKQIPIDEKKQKANYIIENNLDLEHLYRNIDHFLEEIKL
jgi:dephospho-CoA kinase